MSCSFGPNWANFVIFEHLLFVFALMSGRYGGPQLSQQNQKRHSKTKNLTAKTKYLTEKPKTSRQNPRPQGKTKYFAAKTKYFTAKPNTSQQKQILTAEANTLRQKQIPHGKCKDFKAKAKTHGKSKYMHLTLEEESLEPKVLAKDVGPWGQIQHGGIRWVNMFCSNCGTETAPSANFCVTSHRPPRAFYFLIIAILLGYPAGSVWNRSKALSSAETPVGYPNKNSSNRKIESARRTMGRQTQTRPDSELLSCESFIWNNTDKKMYNKTKSIMF